MLTARIHQRLRSDLSEISDALLGSSTPTTSRPPSRRSCSPGRPSAGSARWFSRRQTRTPPLAASRACDAASHDLSAAALPAEVAEGRSFPRARCAARCPEVQSALRIGLRTVGASVSALGSIRCALLDAASGDIHALYELFCATGRRLPARGPEAPGVLLSPESIRPVGFERARVCSNTGGIVPRLPPAPGVLRIPGQNSCSSARRARRGNASLRGRVVRAVRAPEAVAGAARLRVERDHLKLGCTPAVNLFPHQADPIRLTPHRGRVSDPAHATRARRLRSAHGAIRGRSTPSAGSPSRARMRRFYGLRHSSASAESGAYWHAVGAIPTQGDTGRSLLSLVDSSWTCSRRRDDVLHVDLRCTNRDLPTRGRVGDRAATSSSRAARHREHLRAAQADRAAAGADRQRSRWP